MNYFKKYYLSRTKKPFYINKLSDIIGRMTVIIDVGAYHGMFSTEVFSLNNICEIHSFEPSPQAFKELKKKYGKNHRIKLNKVAISNICETRTININEYDETNSLLESVITGSNIDSLIKTKSQEIVDITTLDTYIEKNEIKFIDLIKIDSQGSTYEVLCGLKNALSNRLVDYLYVEVEFIEIYKGQKKFSEVNEHLNQYNYYIHDVCNLNYLENGQLAWCDILYKKHENQYI